MKKLAVLAAAAILTPSLCLAAPLTNQQANSLISVVQASPGVPASAFTDLITAFSNITLTQAESLIAVVQAAPGVPADSFVNMLIAFTQEQTQPTQQPTQTTTTDTTTTPIDTSTTTPTYGNTQSAPTPAPTPLVISQADIQQDGGSVTIRVSTNKPIVSVVVGDGALGSSIDMNRFDAPAVIKAVVNGQSMTFRGGYMNEYQYSPAVPYQSTSVGTAHTTITVTDQDGLQSTRVANLVFFR